MKTRLLVPSLALSLIVGLGAAETQLIHGGGGVNLGDPPRSGA